MEKMKEVEFDYQAEYDVSYRPSSNFEKTLGKRFFYGRSGFNVQTDHNIFITKEEGEQIFDKIQKLSIMKDMGEEMNVLEKIALQVLANSN